MSNTGGLPATGITLSGLAAPFALAGAYPGTGGDCPVTGDLAALSSCKIGIQFQPNAVGTGLQNYSDDLLIDYLDGASPATQVSQTLDGIGLDKATLAITPNPHDYSNVAVGGLSIQTFTVTNSGDYQAQNLADAGMTLPLNYIWANGSYPGHARGTACGIVLDGVSGTNTCELDVAFDPQAPVDINKDGAINLTYDDGLAVGVAATADLDGVPKNPANLQVTSHGLNPFDYGLSS